MIAGAVKIGPAWAKIEAVAKHRAAEREAVRRAENTRRWEEIARQRKLTVCQAENALRQVVPAVLESYRIIECAPIQSAKWSLSMAREILRSIARREGVTVAALVSKARHEPLCSIRLAAYYEIASRTTLSHTQIGRLFGGRDHTTILDGIRAHAKRNGLPLPRGKGIAPEGQGRGAA